MICFEVCVLVAVMGELQLVWSGVLCCMEYPCVAPVTCSQLRVIEVVEWFVVVRLVGCGRTIV